MSDRRDRAEPEFPDFDESADTEAIDLALVHADDEYLDLLGGARLGDGGLGGLDDLDGLDDGPLGDERLTELLMAWRRDVDAEPVDDLVDTRLATVTVAAAKMRAKRRPRLLVPVAAAAAVLAIAFAGFGLAARDAQPGDTLWALSKVLYSERARSVEAAETVKADLAQARAALTEGRVDVAMTKLREADEALPTVLSEDGKDELKAQHEALLAQLPGNPSGDPGAPPVPDPSTQPDPGGGSSSGGDSGTGGGSSSDPTETDSPSPPDNSSPSSPPDDTTDPGTDPPSSDETTTEPPRSEPETGTGGESNSGTGGNESPSLEEGAAPADSGAVVTG